MALYNLVCGLMTSSQITAFNEKISIVELIENFKDKDLLATMSDADKIRATLFVSGLGMAVTFAVLLFLWVCIIILTKVIGAAENKAKKVVEVPSVSKSNKTEDEDLSEDTDEELIAVIAAAIAASMNTSIHNIVVKNIVKVDDYSPSWSKTGRIEQMNTRF